MVKIGVIGGTGFSERVKDSETVKTDYGSVVLGQLHMGGKDVYFIARHYGLDIPSRVNYRGNIQALKLKEVDVIYMASACGRLYCSVLPGHLGCPKDFDHEDPPRITSFSEDGYLLLHASMNPSFSEGLRKIVNDSWSRVESDVREIYGDSPDLKVGYHSEGTYFNIQGPAFSTDAHEHRLRKTVWKPRFIGQTIHPEAILSREMEIAYCPVAQIVDHSNYPGAKPVTHADGVMHAIVKTGEAAYVLIDEAIRNTPEEFYDPICHRALLHSLSKEQVDFRGLRNMGLCNLADILEYELGRREK